MSCSVSRISPPSASGPSSAAGFNTRVTVGGGTEGADWLAGLRVLSFGRNLAESVVATVLADLGADVVRVVRPAEQLLGVQRLLARGQRLLPLELELASGRACAHAWARRADLLIARDLVPGESLSWRLRRESVQAENPRLVEVALPGFSPKWGAVHSPISEAALSAAHGLYARPGPLAPQYFPFPLLSVVAALHALVGGMAARLSADREGVGQRVVVARADVAPSLLELTHLLSAGPVAFGNGLRWASSPFVGAYRCRSSGWLYLHAGLGGHAHRLVEVLASDRPRLAGALGRLLRDEFDSDPLLPVSPRAARRAQRLLGQAFEAHTAEFWEARLGSARISAARVRSLREFAGSPAGLQSGALCVPIAGPAPGALLQRDGAPRVGWQPDEPQQLLPESRANWAEPTGPGGSSPSAGAQACLHGVRVLDLSRIIAGPSAGRTFAWLGAEVLKVEDPLASPAFGPAFRVLFDRGKSIESHDLRSRTGCAKFWARVEEFQPDIVVSNFRPDAAERLGLDPVALAKRLPDAVLVRVSSYGSGGPLAGLPGWEQTAQAVAGIQHTLSRGTRPRLLPLPACDLSTGLVAALGGLLGLWRRERGLATPPLEAALIRTATWLQLRELASEPEALAFDAQGETPSPRFYRCRRGRLLLSGPGNRAAYAALLSELGDKPRGDLSPVAVQQALTRALRRRSARAWQRMLRRRFCAGNHTAPRALAIVVPRGPGGVLRDAGLNRRGLVEVLRYPQVGPVRHARLPVQLSRSPLAPLGPTRLPSHTRPSRELGRRVRRTLQARWEQARFALRALRSL